MELAQIFSAVGWVLWQTFETIIDTYFKNSFVDPLKAECHLNAVSWLHTVHRARAHQVYLQCWGGEGTEKELKLSI